MATGRRHVKIVQGRLKDCGFPIDVDGIDGPMTRRAIRGFQRGYGLSSLPVDGRCPYGSRTYSALKRCARSAGYTTEHFRFQEFGSKRTGWPLIHRSLPLGLEKLRARQGHGVALLSGFREYLPPGGASDSQHGLATIRRYGLDDAFGAAADLANPSLTVREVAALGVFSGIGYSPNGLVRHVDVRHVGVNTTGGSPRNPTIWRYPF